MSLMLFPEEFIDRERYFALDERERAIYGVRLAASMTPELLLGDPDDPDRRRYLDHLIDFASWILPPDEFRRVVRASAWRILEATAEHRADLEALP